MSKRKFVGGGQLAHRREHVRSLVGLEVAACFITDSGLVRMMGPLIRRQEGCRPGYYVQAGIDTQIPLNQIRSINGRTIEVNASYQID
jgi:hypothetical protein